MEVCYLLWGIIDIFQVLPGVVFHPIAFPFDQVEFLSEHSAIQDLLHHIFLFAINKFWWRGWILTSPRNRVLQGWGQLYNVEDWVKVSHRRGEDQAVGVLSNMPFNRIRASA